MIHKLKGGKKSLNGYSSYNGFTRPAVLDNFFMWPLWWHYILKYLFTFLLRPQLLHTAKESFQEWQIPHDAIAVISTQSFQDWPLH